MHELRTFGYSHLIPLGRLNTQEEDQESSFASPSPPRQSSPPVMEEDPIRLTATEQLRANGQGEAAGFENERDLDAELDDLDATGSDLSGEDDQEEEDQDLDASIEDLDGSEEESIRME